MPGASDANGLRPFSDRCSFVAMMQRANLTLPIRLLPRKGGQAIQFLMYGAFAAVPLYWLAKHAGYLDSNPPPTFEIAVQRIGIVALLMSLFFASVGLKGLVPVILKILPRSPFYHLEINAQGLVIRDLVKRELFAWRDLPPFETLRVEEKSRKGRPLVNHYTVSMESLPPPSDLKPGQSCQREVLRIFAEEYGAKNDEQDAADLASWLNELRGLALEGKLSAAQSVPVPDGFAGSAMALGSAHPSAVQR
jgi:hypothetical protein